MSETVGVARGSSCETESHMADRIALAKHHGLGNDFLVWLTDDATLSGVGDLGALARRLCERHRGLGADGLLVGTPGGEDSADVSMVLRNADGSAAEMSGNGIRCLVHAVLRSQERESASGTLAVATDAGLRTVEFGPEREGRPDTIWASVDMGAVTVADADAEPSAERAVRAIVGNPHLVLLDRERRLDLASTGAAHPDVNVEIIRAVGHDGRIGMDVWERGVGYTLACGTGAVAAAVAAQRWGLGGARSTVVMAGGEAEVALSPTATGSTTTLAGPSQWIADVEVAS